jgi:ADP-heptose:LPS heptosyltransferase
MGDILMMTPMLRALRGALPRGRIDFLTRMPFVNVLARNERVDEVIGMAPGVGAWWELVRRIRRAKYDVLIDPFAEPRTNWISIASGVPVRMAWDRKLPHRRWIYNRRVPREKEYAPRQYARFLDALGIDAGDDYSLEFPVGDADRAVAARMLEGVGPGPRVAFSVVAAKARKAWPAERCAALGDLLVREYGARLVMPNGPGQRPQVEQVVGLMKEPAALPGHAPVSLFEFAALLERCDLFVGNDGGPKHIATAMGVPSLSIIERGQEKVWIDDRDPDQVGVFPEREPTGDLLVGDVPLEQVVSAGRPLFERFLRVRD